ncbi:hypothetical protein CAPTEDRAFT_188316, partial [Capitella teleta]
MGRRHPLFMLVFALCGHGELITQRDEVMTITTGIGFGPDYPPRWTQAAASILSCSSACVAIPCCLAAFFNSLDSTCDMYDVKTDELLVDKEGSVFIMRKWDN